ncbi:MAG: type II toxin-antitoxin system RelE/ParE family toxin [Gammaproteobacteria bacterium]
MRTYYFHPEAIAEAEAAASFYAERQKNLGGRFVAALQDAVDRICINPDIYREMDAGLRKCRLKRFPYGVIFREREDMIEIIAVMHLRREPGYWKSRT